MQPRRPRPPLEETGYRSVPNFGLAPKETRGTATLTFHPNGAKPESAIPMGSNWDSLSIALKR